MAGEEHETYTLRRLNDGVRTFFTDTYRVEEDLKYEELFIQERDSPDAAIASDTYHYLEHMR